MDENLTRINLTIGAEKYNVVALEGSEQLSAPYQFVIDIINDVNIPAAGFIGATADLELAARKIYGIITATKANPIDSQKQQVKCTLKSRLALTQLAKTVRVIQDQTVPDLVKMLLLDYGYDNAQIKFHLNKTHDSKPYRMQAPNETDFDFMQRLLKSTGIYYWIDNKDQQEIIHFSDDNRYSPYLPKTVYDPHEITPGFYKLAIDQAGKVEATSNLCDLQAGYSTSLDADAFSKNLSRDYLIQEVQHLAKQNIEHQGEELSYSNQAKLHPREIQFVIPTIAHPEFSGNFVAHTESTGKYAQLSENGELFLRQRFDLSSTPNASASPPLVRLMPYGGTPKDNSQPPIGWQQPLPPEAEVLVTYINDDPDRPLVLGTLPNADKISPVRAINKHQNLIRTLGANQLIMDDMKNQERIELSTYAQNNMLELNADSDNHQINLITKQGAMSWNAKKNINIQTDANTNEEIGNNKTCIATNNYKIKTGKDIHYQAATEYNVIAKENLRLQADNINLTCNNFNINSKNTEITTASNLLLSAQTTLNLNSAKDILLSNKNIMEFSQSGGGLQIGADDSVNFFGKALNVQATQGLTLKGKVNYIPTPAPPVKTAVIPQAMQAATIPDLMPPKETQAKTEPEQSQFNDEFSTQFNPHNQTLKQSKWAVDDQTAKAKPAQFTGKEIKLPNNINNTKFDILTGMNHDQSATN